MHFFQISLIEMILLHLLEVGVNYSQEVKYDECGECENSV